MIDTLKRHEIQVLRRADHTWSEIAALSGVSEKTARRIAKDGGGGNLLKRPLLDRESDHRPDRNL
jgi:hypothetical protein